MEFILRELTEKELLSIYKKQIGELLKEGGKERFLLPEACLRGLIAKHLLTGFGLFAGKTLFCAGLLIEERGGEYLLLDHFTVFPPYRGHNYPNIFFSLLKRFYKKEIKKGGKRKGIFIEVEESDAERKKMLRFFKKLGAYMTDLFPELGEAYNVLYLPLGETISMEEARKGLLRIYSGILPSFREKRERIGRLTDESDGVR